MASLPISPPLRSQQICDLALTHIPTSSAWSQRSTEKWWGCNALDERSEIFAVGPVAVDPDVQNRGIGRALMTAVLERSHLRRASGVRLMQSAYHSRSLSLYAKLGFDVRESFAVINGKQLAPAPSAYSIRAATSDDLEGCNALCQNVHGVARGGELLEAISSGMAKVVERNGSITGYTTGIGYFAHSVAETNDGIIALITHAREFSGPGFLVPLQNSELLRWCLSQGLRIGYTMNLMTIGRYEHPRGPFLASVAF